MASENFEVRGPVEEKNFLTQSVTYHCYWEKFQRPGPVSLFNWKFRTENKSNIPKDEKVLDKYLPVRSVNKDQLVNVPQGQIQVTWLGHATVLVQFDGITILTDPLFRDFCGPEIAHTIKQAAYWRYRRAPCKVEDIPVIDVVIISHNHFDHLDQGSVREICEKHKGVKWLLPKGMKSWFLSHDFQIVASNVFELTWWESQTVTSECSKIEFICVPSQHWCQRRLFDLNKVLWCSWVVKSKNHSFYFGGDTGYHGPLFRKIGEMYGPFTLAAIPIGAYEPRTITGYQHVEPKESVYIHADIKSKMSIGIHWGTFELTNEFFLEPPNEVRRLMGKKAAEFISLCPGETWVVGQARNESPFMGIRSEEDMTL